MCLLLLVVCFAVFKHIATKILFFHMFSAGLHSLMSISLCLGLRIRMDTGPNCPSWRGESGTIASFNKLLSTSGSVIQIFKSRFPAAFYKSIICCTGLHTNTAGKTRERIKSPVSHLWGLNDSEAFVQN